MKKALLLVAALALVLVQRTPAMAHASLAYATPAIGQILSQSPNQVQLTFDDDLQNLGGNSNVIEVTDATGEEVQMGETLLQGATISVALKSLASGRYTVTYRVVSADGHPVSDSYDFVVRLPAATETVAPTPKSIHTGTASQGPTPHASPSRLLQAKSPSKVQKTTDQPTWTLGVAALVLLVLVGVWLLRKRKSNSDL